MMQIWMPLADIPAEGQEFSYDDAEMWEAAWEELGMGLTMKNPLRASVHLLPQKDGVLVSGTIEGSVTAPCDRCAEDSEISFGLTFREYEMMEPEPEDGEDSESEDAPADDSAHLRAGQRGLELDIAGVLWEQFVLALPVKPLCSEQCLGVCPSCGKNLNEGPCECAAEDVDPRMAALRGLKIQ